MQYVDKCTFDNSSLQHLEHGLLHPLSPHVLEHGAAREAAQPPRYLVHLINKHYACNTDNRPLVTMEYSQTLVSGNLY